MAGLAHATHDGYTDMIYSLLPVWQAEFALGYAALALLRGLYAGAMAALQIPAVRVAERFGGRPILVLGTILSALGYGLAGLSGGILGLCVALTLSGAGSSVQHPIASSAVSRAYGAGSRGPLGTYNFAGDPGKGHDPGAGVAAADAHVVAHGAVAHRADRAGNRGGDRPVHATDFSGRRG